MTTKEPHSRANRGWVREDMLWLPATRVITQKSFHPVLLALGPFWASPGLVRARHGFSEFPAMDVASEYLLKGLFQNL